MDADGTENGFDLDLIRLVRREVTIPVIASGGAGKVEHFPPAVDAGADAVLAATVFHFGTLRIADVKRSSPTPAIPCADRTASAFARSRPTWGATSGPMSPRPHSAARLGGAG